MRVSKTCHTFHVNFAVSFFYIVHIYPFFTRKPIVLLSFEQDVCTCFGVVVSEVSGPFVFDVKMGGVLLSGLPKDTTSKLAGLFSTVLQHPLNAERQAVKLWVPLFKVFLV